METKFFNNVAISAAFKRRLVCLATAEPSTVDELRNWISGIKEPPRMDARLGTQFAERTGVALERSYDLLSITWFLVSKFASYGDAADAFCRDLVSEEILSEDQAQAVLPLLEFLAGESPRIHKYQRIAAATGSAIPTLSRMSTAISLRQVTEADFEYDHDSILEFSPKALSFSTVAEIALVVEDVAGNLSSSSWQADAEVLNRFISDLLALQKELELAQSYEKTLENHKGE